jgi:hypothetical protein
VGRSCARIVQSDVSGDPPAGAGGRLGRQPRPWTAGTADGTARRARSARRITPGAQATAGLAARVPGVISRLTTLALPPRSWALLKPGAAAASSCIDAHDWGDAHGPGALGAGRLPPPACLRGQALLAG